MKTKHMVLALLLALGWSSLAYATATEADSETHAAAENDRLWASLLNALTQYGVTRGDDDNAYYDEKPLYGVYDDRQYFAN
ncbi:hypothetical protein LJC74_07425 [Eubacteriales bacterium OttesenSCG-928-A19]|nr:hypothetical protein [Eubacteriales bacterium OttesenSCG-928-A19]